MPPNSRGSPLPSEAGQAGEYSDYSLHPSAAYSLGGCSRQRAQSHTHCSGKSPAPASVSPDDQYTPSYHSMRAPQHDSNPAPRGNSPSTPEAKAPAGDSEADVSRPYEGFLRLVTEDIVPALPGIEESRWRQPM